MCLFHIILSMIVIGNLVNTDMSYFFFLPFISCIGTSVKQVSCGYSSKQLLSLIFLEVKNVDPLLVRNHITPSLDFHIQSIRKIIIKSIRKSKGTALLLSVAESFIISTIMFFS